jgi:hypothetical protein
MFKKLLLSLAFLALSLAGFAKENYLRFTIDGKKYDFPKEVLRMKFRNLSEGGVKYTDLGLTTPFVKLQGQNIIVELHFLNVEGAKPGEGKQPVSNNIGFRTSLPLAYFKLSIHTGKGFLHYETNVPEDGTIEISSVEDYIVEGTFSLSLTEITTKEKLIIKKGCFRVTLIE